MPQLALWVLWVAQINNIRAATEAACLVLSVDETIKNPKVKNKWFFFWL
jgi:T-complex protein 1 subunit eta